MEKKERRRILSGFNVSGKICLGLLLFAQEGMAGTVGWLCTHVPGKG